jgi:ER-bound oxygenase mpaB/B'/Rubber oxygenase, catalytic domain
MTSPLPAASRWTDEFLDEMRKVADPEADALTQEVFNAGGVEALLKLKPFYDTWDAPPSDALPPRIREFFERPVNYPAWVDQELIRHAERLFVSYGPVTTVVLLLNAVPHFFTNPAGARSFYLAQIFNPDSVKSRMHEVPQFVINITQAEGLLQKPDASAPYGFNKGPGIITAQKLRMAHARIRILLKLRQKDPTKNWDGQSLGEPINQEDLAEALMHFCLWTIEGLKKVGITQERKDTEAFLMSWKTVGFLLGLREELQPANVEEAFLLRDTITRRWTYPTAEGAYLINQMLGIVCGMLPWGYRSLPAGLMRYQLGDEVADVLQVPNPRRLIWLLNALKPFWEQDKAFAKFAMWISPPIVNWLVTHDRASHRGKFFMPEELARSWGLLK